ncbi:hypothetical protein ACG0TJ_26920, partial [Klebsiella pneumoniae]
QPPFAQNGTVVNLRMSTRFCTKGDGFQFLAKFAILPQNANSQLYYRPAKLALAPDQAAEKLTFSRSGSSLTLTNPTPYYLTVTELNAGTRILENALVPPMGKTSVKLPPDAGSRITYRTINDYGALTPTMNGVLR